MPSTGIDRNTGKVLRDLDHVRQSVGVIFTTPYGARIMRRTFGSDVPPILGRADLSAQALLRFFYGIALAIELWEPRLRYKQAKFPPASNTLSANRQGALGVEIQCRYRPNALQGDTTSDVVTIDL